MLRTLPFTMVPGGYFFSISSHGLLSNWRRPKEIFCSSLFTPSTLASTTWPTLSTSAGRTMRLVQDNSETWMRPSTPSSSSTNAP